MSFKSFLLSLTIFISCYSFSSAQVVDIPDPNFLSALISNGVDNNGDGMIQVDEALDKVFLNLDSKDINSLEGINSFSNLESLSCRGNNLTELHLELGQLSTLQCSGNEINSIDISQCLNLSSISCGDNLIEDLDLQYNSLITSVSCEKNMISQLNLSHLTNLTYLVCRDNPLSDVDLSSNTLLEILSCDFLPSNLTDLQNLTDLWIFYDGLASIDLSNQTLLKDLRLIGGNMDIIDLSNKQSLERVVFGNMTIDNLNFTNCSSIIEIRAPNVELNGLNIEGCTSLESLTVDGNNLSTLDLSTNISLQLLDCERNNLTNLDLSNNLVVGNLNISENEFSQISLNYLSLLTSLDISKNKFSSIDLSENLYLRKFFCSDNLFATLELTNNSNLTFLNCSNNNLDNLNILDNVLLEDLYCHNNNLTTLNFLDLIYIQVLDCSDNNIQTTDLSQMIELRDFDCSNNIIDELILPQNPSRDFTDFICSNNYLKTLDFSKNPIRSTLECEDNPIVYLNLADGNIMSDTSEKIYNDSLKYICIDENEYQWLSEGMGDDVDKVSVNTYCNFSLSDGLNCVTGKNNYDASGTCNANSITVTQVPFLIKQDTLQYKFWPAYYNDAYKMFFGSGTHQIQHCLDENLFVSSPDSIILDFAGTTDVISEDFCVGPKNGINVTDLAVSMIPLKDTRAGFNSDYRIIIENLGNTFSSGSIQVNFPLDTVQILSSTENYTVNGNVITWNYTDLPILTRKIIYFNTRNNSPMDVPPLTGGEILKFTAQVIPNVTDHHPIDNSVSICQTVVNSYDPNDKRCLQGDVLIDSLVGIYLDYMIRFENTGSADAINITVRDTLDSDVYDISTFRLIDASHPVHVSQKENIIDFIFKDINLPFEDSTNDGYVVFKIKSSENLKAGDNITNKADIYFDFNWPIRTNTDTVEIIDPFQLADMDDDGYTAEEDCDDTNSEINPGQSEIPYNSLDDDCNPLTLDDDLDQDGFNLADDCDDNNADINPDQSEVLYNSIDDDCNPSTLDDDLDQDGFNLANDCDDNNPNVNPSQTEIVYNAIDDDCNPDTLDDDLDQDGFNLSEDCDDNNPSINPDQVEIAYNLIDDDCNPLTFDDDLDQDGFNLVDDCDDNNPNVNPDGTEIPYNGLDDDCNTSTLDDDLDQDGYLSLNDCNDENSSINPGAAEICDGLDNDCDEAIDEDFPTDNYYPDNDGDGFGLGEAGITSCDSIEGYVTVSGDCDDFDPLINPDAEDIINNGIDEDCDGMDAVSSVIDIFSDNVKIYPNPTRGIVNIHNQLNNPLIFRISNTNGKIVSNGILKYGISEIHLSGLTSGVYFIKLLSDGKNKTEKLIIQ